MLSSQEIQAQLKQVRVPAGAGLRLSRVSQMGRRTRGVARGLLGLDVSGKPLEAGSGRTKVLDVALEALDGMKPSERAEVWQAFFPSIALHVERAWQLQAGMPYLYGPLRRPFRAPNNPRASRAVRWLWLVDMLGLMDKYHQGVAWLAAWAPHLGWAPPACLNALLAAAIDGGGPEGEAVFRTLCASASGEHEIGVMGRHVPGALLAASRPDGWAFVERMLLAAERQEGLRQAILETVDLSHPQAFRRMLRLVVEHNLVRFAATVRAANTWFGLPFDVEKTRDVREVLEQALLYLEQPPARAAAVEGGSGREAYLALWSSAFDDAVAALSPATRLRSDRDPERRFAATYLLAQANLVGGLQAASKGLGDGDLRVVWAALQCFLPEPDERLVSPALFESLEQVAARLPKKKELEPVLWPWLRLTLDRETVYGVLVQCLGDLPATRLVRHLAAMPARQRAGTARLLAGSERPQARAALLDLLRDPAEAVREQALKGLARQPVKAEEALVLEGMLSHRAPDLRAGVAALLLGQKDGAVLASARRLLEAPDSLQRMAGLGLLQAMVEAGRAVGECRAAAGGYQARTTNLPEAELEVLSRLLERGRREPTLEDALGLMDPSQRSRPVPPRRIKPPLARPGDRSLVSEAALACLESLSMLVEAHRQDPIAWEAPGGRREELLGEVQLFFVWPDLTLTHEQDAHRLPLRELWEDWWAARPPALRDPDGLELLRADVLFHTHEWQAEYLAKHPAAWLREAWALLLGDADRRTLRYEPIVSKILDWLMRLHPPAGGSDFVLDALECALAQVPPKEIARAALKPDTGRVIAVKPLPGTPGTDDPEWRDAPPVAAWLELARHHRRHCPQAWEARHHLRLWGLLRWVDEPGVPMPRRRPELEEVVAAFGAGGATEADILDRLLGTRTEKDEVWRRWGFDDLRTLTSRKPASIALRYPVLQELTARCRRRIIEVELDRAELPTAASLPARVLRSSGGVDVLVALLRAMRDEPFERGYSGALSRAGVLGHLVLVSAPEPGDTPEAFGAAVRGAGLGEKHLLDLAAYAPQWARLVEHTLAWPGLEEAVWWLHAHTRDRSWTIDPEVLDGWKAEIQQRTPLLPDDLLQGAVDVTWFWRAYTALDEKRWIALDRAAPSTGVGGGHKRAQLFADAMRGRLSKDDVLSRITAKRHQDSVRALGLLPLPEGDACQAEVLERYEAIQEFVRTGRKFGAQRRENEKLAARIALENLARTAGYPDPQRLEWAMEARQSADLSSGPVTASAGEVTVTLVLDDLGRPQITVDKAGKPLKAIPPAAKKDPSVAVLRERARGLERQASRTRQSLEQAMCRGDAFTGAELRLLSAHPVLGPMIEDLVFLGEAAAGYPADRGQALQSHDGRRAPVALGARLCLAHPLDLLETREWHVWQRECFLAERVQPFKQVFRELYVLTEAERAGGTVSRRYAGHQVRPGQAQALLAGRGWIAEHEVGIYHTDHDSGITAWLDTPVVWFTPAEVEGTTIEGVHFTRRGEWQPMPLDEVPPRLFSEVMRDLDLVVSVAHAGGVDPEASASTVELRAGLVAETCAALKLENVRLQLPRILVEGRLASYSVHLGSAVVHRQPGGQVCIAPVHAQQRGRLFLPFADDDPKTAEVLSKVLLLARDWEIKDPVILEQILAGR